MGQLAPPIALAMIAVLAAGCPLRDLLRPRRTPAPAPAPVPTPGPVEINALPVYRLIVSPVDVDAPSRLAVLYVRMRANEDTAFSVRLDDMTLTLPSGEEALVLDRPRAIEVVQRTTLGDLNLFYLQQPELYSPGGISAAERPQRINLILSSLFSDAVLSRSTPLEGYVVADTRQPTTSLTGASIAITAHRLNDASAAQASYEFPPPQSPTATAAPPASTPAFVLEPSAAAPAPAATAESAAPPEGATTPAAAEVPTAAVPDGAAAPAPAAAPAVAATPQAEQQP